MYFFIFFNDILIFIIMAMLLKNYLTCFEVIKGVQVNCKNEPS
jgi:hypothetical protein